MIESEYAAKVPLLKHPPIVIIFIIGIGSVSTIVYDQFILSVHIDSGLYITTSDRNVWLLIFPNTDNMNRCQTLHQRGGQLMNGTCERIHVILPSSGLHTRWSRSSLPANTAPIHILDTHLSAGFPHRINAGDACHLRTACLNEPPYPPHNSVRHISSRAVK